MLQNIEENTTIRYLDSETGSLSEELFARVKKCHRRNKNYKSPVRPAFSKPDYNEFSVKTIFFSCPSFFFVVCTYLTKPDYSERFNCSVMFIITGVYCTCMYM